MGSNFMVRSNQYLELGLIFSPSGKLFDIINISLSEVLVSARYFVGFQVNNNYYLFIGDFMI